MISRADALAILRRFPATVVAACSVPSAFHWYPIMRRPLLLPLCLAAALLAGCGNKGPLYLPNNPHPPVYVPPQPAPAPAQSAPAPAGSSAAPATTH